MGKLIYGDLIRADKLKPGDIVEYENIPVNIVSVDVIEGINPNFPDPVHIQLDHPILARISWGASCVDYIQRIETERIMIPAFMQKKEQPKKLKLRIPTKPIKKKLKIPTKR
jgi:hypothetical protein